MRSRRLRAAFAAASLLTVASCSSDVISLSPDEADVKPCRPDTPPPTIGATEVDLLPTVSVEDLPTTSPVPCDYADWALVFPDGQKHQTGEVASSRGAQDTNGSWKAWTNLGV